MQGDCHVARAWHRCTWMRNGAGQRKARLIRALGAADSSRSAPAAGCGLRLRQCLGGAAELYVARAASRPRRAVWGIGFPAGCDGQSGVYVMSPSSPWDRSVLMRARRKEKRFPGLGALDSHGSLLRSGAPSSTNPDARVGEYHRRRVKGIAFGFRLMRISGAWLARWSLHSIHPLD